MDASVLIFLSSGLFLGWALGANDAANVFGTAVGTRMVRFSTAAIICSIFIIIGAVWGGAGTASTLSKLGAVNALPGAFMAALSAALSVYLMTKAGLPVSTSQAIVGAIIGWNLFSGTLTDANTLTKIISTWVLCPLLAAIFGAVIFKITVKAMRFAKMHLIRVDAYTRLGLLLAGAFGSYSLGANNIANVVGVFVSASPFDNISIGGFFTLSSMQQLFLMGAIAIAVGVFTYSKRVMMTIGNDLLPLSPVGAWVAVVSHSIVLFLFASEGLKYALENRGLPSIPLVPVSSSQAVVGAVLGIALVQGGQGLRWRVFGSISLGWIVTPVIASVICFLGLFFLQNVFNQQTFRVVPYFLSNDALDRLAKAGVSQSALEPIIGERYDNAVAMDQALIEIGKYSARDREKIMDFSRRTPILIDQKFFTKLNRGLLSPERLEAVHQLNGRFYPYEWMLGDDLAKLSRSWRKKENKRYNQILKQDLQFLIKLFRAK